MQKIPPCHTTHKKMSHWSKLSVHLCETACSSGSITLIQTLVCVCKILHAKFFQPGSLKTIGINVDTEWYYIFINLFFSLLHKIECTNTAPWLGEQQGFALMTNKLSMFTNISAPQMKYRFSKSWWVLGEGMFVCIWVCDHFPLLLFYSKKSHG